MTRWEYIITPLMPESDMNLHGRYGWELVAVHDGKLYWRRASQGSETDGR